MLFEYTVLQNGQKKRGEMEATSEKELADYLKSNGQFPIDIAEKKTSTFSSLSSILQPVSATDITYITRQFAIMLDAGLTLIDAIGIIHQQVAKPSVEKMLGSIDKLLRDGKTFSSALALYPKQFSNFYIALVRSGEASGKLDVILEKLAEHMERQREFQQKIKNALIYPIVIISAMFAMLFVMFAFVMPKLLELFDSFQVELPTSTIIVMAISDFMEANWMWVIIGIAAVLITMMKLKSTKKGKIFFDTNVFRIPVLGNIIRISGLVDATRTLSILISSGVPILDGLAIVTEVNSNVVFQEAFKRITQKVEKGMSVGAAMKNEKIFPDSLVQMTIVGEQTGHLDVTLLKLAEYYQSESEMAVKGMLTLLEPMILIVLGVTVGFVVMAVITPIFTLTSSFQ